MFENFLYFRCPHQREVRPAGAQQVLLRIADVEMLQHRLQWAERMGFRTVFGQGDQMERPIASQNRLAAAIEFQGWQNARLVEVLQMQSAGRPLCLRCGRWGHLASTCGRS